MDMWRALAARFALAAVCVFPAIPVVAQERAPQPSPQPQPQPVRRFRPELTQVPRLPVTQTVPPAPKKMPDVRWLDAAMASRFIVGTFDRMPQVNGDRADPVIAQSPEPGADAGPNTLLTITLGKPALLLKVSNTAPNINEAVGVDFVVDPPLRQGLEAITYHVAWGDGSEETLASPAAKHAFTEARRYDLTAYAVIAGRWRTDMASTAISVAAPPPRKMPDVRWFDIKRAEVAIRDAVGNVAKTTGDVRDLVIAQSPEAGADVSADTPLMLTLGKPVVQLKVSNSAPKTNEEIGLQLAFDQPPPPSAPAIEYHVMWGDGSEETLTSPAAKHAFAEARAYQLSAYAVIAGRSRTDAASTTISVAAPVVLPPDKKPAAPTEQPSQPPLPPWRNPLVIAAAVVVLALISWALKGKKPPVQEAGRPPSVSIRHGLGKSTHTIDHAEGLRGGLNVRLRSGVRSVVVFKGGSDA